MDLIILYTSLPCALYYKVFCPLVYYVHPTQPLLRGNVTTELLWNQTQGVRAILCCSLLLVAFSKNECSWKLQGKNPTFLSKKRKRSKHRILTYGVFVWHGPTSRVLIDQTNWPVQE